MSVPNSLLLPGKTLIVLYRNQFKDPEVFLELLEALGKNPADSSILLTINQNIKNLEVIS